MQEDNKQGEKIIYPLQTKWLMVLALKLAFFMGLIPLGFLLYINFGYPKLFSSDTNIVILILVLFIAFLYLCFVSLSFFRRKKINYLLLDKSFKFSNKVLANREEEIPYDSIESVEVKQDPLEKSFGLSSLWINSSHAKMTIMIPGMKPKDAETLRSDLLSKIGH